MTKWIASESCYDVFGEIGGVLWGKKFSNGAEVWFALYDPECEYIEVCLSYPHRDFNFHQEASKMEFAADGKGLGNWSFIGHSNDRECIWKKHLIILIEDASEYSEITLDYLGDRVTIVR